MTSEQQTLSLITKKHDQNSGFSIGIKEHHSRQIFHHSLKGFNEP